jgi:hypothetical protein
MTILQKDGVKQQITLKDCKYVPGMKVNLFSITKALKQGWNLSNQGVNIVLANKSQKLIFDQIIPTETGHLVGITMYPTKDYANITMTASPIDINLYHKIMGHTSENALRDTAKFYGITLSNSLQTCSDCALSKSKQKSV